jgi:hypothetical protein
MRLETLGNPAWADNWATGGRTPHMEVMSGRCVWLAQAPCTVEESVRRVELAADVVVELPCPTRVTVFAPGDSFHGPVRLAA